MKIGIGINISSQNVPLKSSGGGEVGIKPYARYSAKGKSNQDSDRNILKDLSGHGRDILLEGFEFNETSGYIGYVEKFNKLYMIDSAAGYVSFDLFEISIRQTKKINTPLIYKSKPNVSLPYKIQVTGIDSIGGFILYYNYIDGDNLNRLSISKDGEYTIPASILNEGSVLKNINFSCNKIVDNCNIVITQLPQEKSGDLLFDGVNDCSSNFSIPRLKGTLLFSFAHYGKENSIGSVLYPYGSSNKNGFLIANDFTRTAKVMLCDNTSINNLDIPILRNLFLIFRWDGETIWVGGDALGSVKSIMGYDFMILGKDGFFGTMFECFSFNDMCIYDKCLTDEEIVQEKIKYQIV